MLFRVALIAGVVVAATPSSVLRNHAGQDQRDNLPFCTRNPHTCGAVGEAWDGLKEKGQVLAEIAMQVTQNANTQSAAGDHNHRAQPMPQYTHENFEQRSTHPGTLPPADKWPAWRGPTTER